MSKHTPGPWKVFTAKDGVTVIGIGEIRGEGITDGGFGLWREGEEARDNAYLIAAAPKLLAELKKARGLLVQQTRSKDIHDGRFTEIDAIIAKAEGKSR